jgi:hypothetical protein
MDPTSLEITVLGLSFITLSRFLYDLFQREKPDYQSKIANLYEVVAYLRLQISEQQLENTQINSLQQQIYELQSQMSEFSTSNTKINELQTQMLEISTSVTQIKALQDSEDDLEVDVEQYQLIPPNKIEEAKAQIEQEDKHDILRKLLKDSAHVFCSYKGTQIDATFHLKETAPHGYVIRDSQNVEYETPTHFSFTKKREINPKIHSDNGWDSVYIHKGQTKKGKPKKLSLKALVDSNTE